MQACGGDGRKGARKEGLEVGLHHPEGAHTHTHSPHCNLPGAATALHPRPDGRPRRARCLRTRGWRGQRQHCCSRCSRCCSSPSYCRGASRRRRRRKAGPCVVALRWPVLVLVLVEVLVAVTCVCTCGGEGSELFVRLAGKQRREGGRSTAWAKLAMSSARCNGHSSTIHTHSTSQCVLVCR